MTTPASAKPATLVRVPAGTTAASAVREAGLSTKGPDAIVVVRDDEGALRDLAWIPDVDVEVEAVGADTEDGRSVIRHSAAHVLAQAVQQEFPEAKLGIGPPIKDGFYYDFQVERPFTPEDLAKLEKRMKKIVKDAQRFSRRVVENIEDAREELQNEPFKLELIDDKSGSSDFEPDPEIMEVGGKELTIYDNLNPRTGELVWKRPVPWPAPADHQVHPGVQAHPQLRRVLARRPGQRRPPADLRHRVGIHRGARGVTWNYSPRPSAAITASSAPNSTCSRFPDELGSGLPVFHPKGGIIRQEMENYSRQRHVDAGYEFVNTPHITKGHLYEVSGHLDWYKDGMFPAMHIDEELNDDGTIRKPGQDYYLKPMNCPMHDLIFRSRGRSYRELPLRCSSSAPSIATRSPVSSTDSHVCAA